MNRAFLVVLDSVGIGGAPDAGAYGDAGANTVGHIAAACAAGRAETGRSGPLRLPVLCSLGLDGAMRIATGASPFAAVQRRAGAFWAAAEERSRGKDTPSGHWELAGQPVPWDWHVFPPGPPAFPAALRAAICRYAACDGILGDRAASGTEILGELGSEHVATGRPICYTSTDSVFQIAAHEDPEIFGLDRLLELCAALAPQLHQMRVGRVIARPFVGDADAGFRRTGNRHDFAHPLPGPALCDWVQKAGRRVLGIGKIGDIFSMQGIDETVRGSDRDLAAALRRSLATAAPGDLVFANLVEFDSLYGHRRDVAGYARALEWIDEELGALADALRPGDMMLVTADHGNDPTWRGTDHTRERVPILGRVAGGPSAGDCGLASFADVAATVAAHLGVPNGGPGRSLLPK